MDFSSRNNRNFLEKVRRENSLDLIGVADIREAREHFEGLSRRVVEELRLAVVIAVRVSPTVLSTLEDGPNLLYFHHYRQLNSLLDQAALGITREIERKGYSAIPIAASQVFDWEKLIGHVSHRELAYLAGLGWRGRNNLLVTAKWGSQVRLASILTDFPLEPACPLIGDCGSCYCCLSACPAKAIEEEPTAFDRLACYEQLKEFSRSRRIGQYVCGLCVKACSGLAGG